MLHTQIREFVNSAPQSHNELPNKENMSQSILTGEFICGTSESVQAEEDGVEVTLGQLLHGRSIDRNC
jgi:hypothetical protein